MQRVPTAPRDGWLETVEAQGLSYALDRTETTEGVLYWDESAHYDLTTTEVDHLEEVTETLHAMVLQAVDRMVGDPALLARLALPPGAAELLRRSWRDEGEISLYGRFDLAWGGEGTGEPLLLEYNADTPTALLEASVVQWHWLEDRFPEHDQWNLLHERLVQAWRRIKEREGIALAHFAVGQTEPTEDWATAAYLRDTAQEAGLIALGITMEEIGWDPDAGEFVDLEERPIRHCYKLYPTEWVLDSPFGRYVLDGTAATRWIEPPWKLLAASKAVLPVLWEMFPGHRNLLPAYFDGPHAMPAYAAKPLYGWEGDGVRIVSPDGVEGREPTHTQGQTLVFQQYTELPCFDGHRAVLGTWMVGEHAAGLGVRESGTLITDTRSRFVPHRVLAPRSTPEQVAQWLRA